VPLIAAAIWIGHLIHFTGISLGLSYFSGENFGILQDFDGGSIPNDSSPRLVGGKLPNCD
jgi:hypothetical protein